MQQSVAQTTAMQWSAANKLLFIQSIRHIIKLGVIARVQYRLDDLWPFRAFSPDLPRYCCSTLYTVVAAAQSESTAVRFLAIKVCMATAVVHYTLQQQQHSQRVLLSGSQLSRYVWLLLQYTIHCSSSSTVREYCCQVPSYQGMYGYCCSTLYTVVAAAQSESTAIRFLAIKVCMATAVVHYTLQQQQHSQRVLLSGSQLSRYVWLLLQYTIHCSSSSTVREYCCQVPSYQGMYGYCCSTLYTVVAAAQSESTAVRFLAIKVCMATAVVHYTLQQQQHSQRVLLSGSQLSRYVWLLLQYTIHCSSSSTVREYCCQVPSYQGMYGYCCSTLYTVVAAAQSESTAVRFLAIKVCMATANMTCCCTASCTYQLH